jgi:SAM-dependent methyltransferase
VESIEYPSIRMDGSTSEVPAGVAMLGWMGSLAEPTRARALRLLDGRELTVADVCAVLRAPQSTVSRHLKVLADDGWISARPEGTSRLYRMTSAALDPAARRLWALLREQTSRTAIAADDDRRLELVLAERRSRSQAFFRSSAGQWEKLRRELFGERFDAVALAAWLEDTWVVGDLGCGNGQMAELIAPFVERVVAVERSSAMLASARRRLAVHPNVDVRQGELEALPIEDDALDAATLGLVLHHVADPGEVMRETARVLRPGGRVLIVDMMKHDRAEYAQQMGHVWLGFEPAKLVEWLGEAGFEGARVTRLPAEAAARGPGLFVATARAARNTNHRNGRRIATTQKRRTR